MSSRKYLNTAETAKLIRLTLKKQWFDMIASGQKLEEYRELKPYWHKRLRNRQYAATKLASGGRLVAILPASANGKDNLLPSNFACEWSKVYENEFSGTSVAVVILSATLTA